MLALLPAVPFGPCQNINDCPPFPDDPILKNPPLGVTLRFPLESVTKLVLPLPFVRVNVPLVVLRPPAKVETVDDVAVIYPTVGDVVAEATPPAKERRPVAAERFAPVPPYWEPMSVPCQMPEVIVPIVARFARLVISVPMSFDPAIEPASIVFVTLPAPIVVVMAVEPEPETSPERVMVWFEAR